ncbi:hypothetical protein WJX84_010748 [Apatococcus fuscideae]|uniref:Secreted protein n=1 Tax=Apatococcus fuscideae TaxID=2026836 RepID=A0AAW1T0Q9_9CHLO
MLSLAAAVGDLALLSWVVAQLATRRHKVVHSECSDARMLLLVHSHSWCLPGELREGVQQQKRAAWPSMAQSGTSSSLKDGVPILEHYQTSSSSPLPAWQTLTSAGHCALEVASVLMDCLG